MPRVRRCVTQRLWEKVKVQSNGCWLWMGATDTQGYGCMRVDNDFGLQESMRVHRVSYLAFRGEIPDGMSVLHHCDTPRCVNPEHLFCGFQSANMADMKAKLRDNSYGHKGPAGTTTTVAARQSAAEAAA